MAKNKYAEMADEPQAGAKPAAKVVAKPATKAPSKYAQMADDYDPSAAEVWQGVKKNLGQGVVDFGKAVGAAYRSPVDAAYNLATGAVKLEEALVPTPENAAALARGVGAVAQGFKDNWFSGGPAARRYIRDHPYMAFNDVLTFAPLPGAAGSVLAKGAAKVVPAGVKAAAKTVGSAAAKGAAKATPTILKNALASTPAKAAGHLAAAAVHPMRAVNKVAAKAAAAAPGVARGLENVYNAKLGFVGGVTGGVDNAKRMVSELSRPDNLLPGYTPSPAEVIVPRMEGAHKLAAVQQSADALTGQGVLRDANNLAAVRGAVNEIGMNTTGAPIRDIGARQIAIENQMRAADKANYGVSDSQWVQFTPEMQERISSAYAPGVVDRAKTLASETNNPMFQSGATSINRPVTNPLTNTRSIVPDENVLAISGKGYSDIKMSIRDILKKASDPNSTMTSREMAELMSRATDLNDQMRAALPSLAKADDVHKVNARVWDRSEFARNLENKLKDRTFNQGAFNNAIENSFGETRMRIDNLPNNAGRFYERKEDLLTPKELTTLDRSQEVFDRRQQVAHLASSTTTPDVSNVLSNAMGGGHPRWWTTVLAGNQDDRIAAEIVESMRTPEGASEMLRQYLGREATLAERRMFFDKVVAANRYNPLRVMNNNPALYNVLGQRDQQEQQR